MLALSIIVNICQLIGGLVIGLSYLPQIIQILKTKSVQDLNLTSYVTLGIGLGLTELYALYLLIAQGLGMYLLTNSIGLITIIIMIILVIKYKKR